MDGILTFFLRWWVTESERARIRDDVHLIDDRRLRMVCLKFVCFVVLLFFNCLCVCVGS